MLDHYYWGRCERISPEAPVPIVEVERESWTLGGAGNVVKNLLALGGQVEVLGVRGTDEAGGKLLSRLQEQGVGTEGLVAVEGRPTTVKSRLIAGHQQVIRFDHETKAPISEELVAELAARLPAFIAETAAVVVSDYGKGFLTSALLQALIAEARRQQKPVFVDPKGRDYHRYRGATLLTPNRKEAQEATGITLDSPAAIERAARQLQQQLDLTVAVITLSEDGMALYDGALHLVPTTAREVYDVTGAGDTSIAALVYAHLQGQSWTACAQFANAAAAVVIAKLGSEVATLAEIEAYQKREGHN